MVKPETPSQQKPAPSTTLGPNVGPGVAAVPSELRVPPTGKLPVIGAVFLLVVVLGLLRLPLAMLIVLPGLFFCVQVFAGTWGAGRLRRQLRPEVISATATAAELQAKREHHPREYSYLTGFEGRLAVLVPAHNEAEVLAGTLVSIKHQLRATDRLVVVADNCTDTTADIARSQGAEVIERRHDTKRGKGFALDFGVDYLREGPAENIKETDAFAQPAQTPDIVVIIDADCQLAPGCMAALVEACERVRAPVQGLYLIEGEPALDFRARVAAAGHAMPEVGESLPRLNVGDIALRLRNHFRPLGLARLGGYVPLQGSGMAFPWSALEGVDVASSALAEDMKLGLDLARAGKGAHFCEAARLTSRSAPSSAAASTQHKRWVHGHIELMLTSAPLLFLSGLLRLDLRRILLACDVWILPLTGLLAVYALVAGLSGVVAVLGHLGFVGADAFFLSTRFFVWFGLGGFLLLLGVLRAWVVAGYYGRVPSLAAIPLYAVRAGMSVATSLLKREKRWVRTKRTDDDA